MLLLYIAGLCFLIANIIFDLRTPRIVREYPNRHAFVGACVADAFLKIQYLAEHNRASSGYAKAIASNIEWTQEQNKEKIRIKIENLFESANADFWITELEKHWNTRNHVGRDSCRNTRAVIWLLYIVASTILFGLTFLDAPIRVAWAQFGT
ncbi:hypothetical protein DXT89_08565 [Agrobacterium vitis]|uniref:Uncharacterized protein n=2 Tax=Agrobacterium vitis TaxID=373 RepID=A0A368NQC4_AGRVI|nr:hypothetical protein DXM22_11040 [Agrobacterium vitis]KAA3529746.1 hypothetical protein DXT89_08565 [Agrobacterium vitis]RCU52300.1 hypothetical protein ASB66_019400 [Agrobacterium vitis]